MATATKRRREPRVNRGDPCAQCGGERPDIARRENDPFCKSTCCRAYHGIVFSCDTTQRRKNLTSA